MKTAVHHDNDDTRVEGRVEITVETDEDCHLAQHRLDALSGSTKDESGCDESEALRNAIKEWHARKPLV